MVLGNGSTDVINFVVHTFVAPGEEVVLPIPTFPMYEARTRVAGGVPIHIPMKADFYWDVDAILKAVNPRTKLMFICSPNNPTGLQIAEKDLLRLLELGIPLFFDEAYYELENEVHSYASLVSDYPHLMVSRTFSKAFGLAGCRIGYLLCDPKLASYFNRVRIPVECQPACLWPQRWPGLMTRQDQQRKRRNVIEGRNTIFEEINRIPGLHAYPSEGNFVLIDASALDKDSLEIRDRMAEKGIYIRPMSGHNMAQGFIRVTVGTPDQNALFIRTFKEYVREVQRK